jgi:hypothetical protein
MTRKPMLVLALAASAAAADPGYYVVTPYDNAGVRTVDVRYWTVKSENRPAVIWPELGLAYGVNSRWTTGVFVSWIGSSQAATRPSTVNWQNQFLLTQGELPLDVALHVQFIRDRIRTERHAVEFGPVLQTDIGRTQLNANVFFERGQGAARAEPTQMKYQWQVRHRWRPGLHLGLTGFGEVGPWDQWSSQAAQSHRAGPALFGSLRWDGEQALHWQAAWVAGKTYARRGHMFTMRVHHNF